MTDAPGTASRARTRSPRRSAPPDRPLKDAPVPSAVARVFATRPLPPDGMDGSAAWAGPPFVPAPDAAAWLLRVFCDPQSGSPLHNPDHAHLATAHLGVLFANDPSRHQGRTILGQCEIPQPAGSRWASMRGAAQLAAWFGAVPDALLTFDVAYATRCDPTAWCALAEHELRHCAQKVTGEGEPMFSRETGRPLLTLRGHDAELFIGDVRRYGMAVPGVREIVHAATQAQREPVFAEGAIAAACGTCKASV